MCGKEFVAEEIDGAENFTCPQIQIVWPLQEQ